MYPVPQEQLRVPDSLRSNTVSRQSNRTDSRNNPSYPSSSFRNVHIVETTQNFIQILDTYTQQEQIIDFNEARRVGIRVEDLINRFKSESKFDTMSKQKGQKKDGKGQTEEAQPKIGKF